MVCVIFVVSGGEGGKDANIVLRGLTAIRRLPQKKSILGHLPTMAPVTIFPTAE